MTDRPRPGSFPSPAQRVTHRGAVFSVRESNPMTGPTYRYFLTRAWPFGKDRVTFVMLNPSTADERQDDPTIRRCISFAMQWGYQALTIVNLFALRATDPVRLYGHPDPVGPENDRWIREAAEDSARVVCAWGVHGALRDRGRHVLVLLEAIDRNVVWCFGKTKAAAPRHPLYLPGNSVLERWWP